MINFSKITAEGLESSMDFELPTGMSAAVITSHERENDVLVKLILGFQSLRGGSIAVNNLQPQTLTDAELCAFRHNVGVVYSDGGMISNLNVWENLTLQLSYDGEVGRGEIESRGITALRVAGYDGPLGVLPSLLTLFQRRQIAFARMILAAPDLVVYQSLLDGLSRSEQLHLRTITGDYRRQNTGRTALFLTSFPDSINGLGLDFIYNTGGTIKS